MRRRDFTFALGVAALPLPAPAWAKGRFDKDLASLEARSRGRLGVAALDLETGGRLAWRADERFPMCSTFKFLAAARVLARVDQGKDQLGRRVVFSAADLVEHSPVTKAQVGPPGMTLAALCEATMTLSDNAAANLLLASFGGPAGLTAWCRTLGDPVTRLDRDEPGLNEARPDDPRDTTSPRAMLGNLNRLVIGDGLKPGSRQRLTGWLVANQTGDARLRAGVPKAWRVGDKTGSGANGTTNDIGVFWPPGRRPILVSAYLTGAMTSGEARNAILAEVGGLVSRMI